ncbi:hypothetical protein THIOKS1720011 [Thiocapsa sp. KS1]|nr:hypothetical protein THIOKS1720011 [Thiocapsa sp. KS1]
MSRHSVMNSGSPLRAEMARTTPSSRPGGRVSDSISVTKPCSYSDLTISSTAWVEVISPGSVFLSVLLGIYYTPFSTGFNIPREIRNGKYRFGSIGVLCHVRAPHQGFKGFRSACRIMTGLYSNFREAFSMDLLMRTVPIILPA